MCKKEFEKRVFSFFFLPFPHQEDKMEKIKENRQNLYTIIAVVFVVFFWSLYHLISQGLPRNGLFHEMTTSPLVSSMDLFLFRLLCSVLCIVTLFVVYTDKMGLVIQYDGATLNLVGVLRFSTFTVTTFCLLTLYFITTSFLTAVSIWFEDPNNLPMIETVSIATFYIFEVIYPCSVLVTTLVSHVLYPAAIRFRPETLERMFVWPVVVMHNLNVVVMNLELILCSPPILSSHFPICLVWGCSYVSFALWWYFQTGVFYYFFMDYRRKYAVLVYLALMAGLIAFFFVAYAVYSLSCDPETRYWSWPLLVFGTWAISRFRPYHKQN